MTPEEIFEHHARCAAIMAQKARDNLSKLRTKALDVDTHLNGEQWREHAVPIYDALHKMTAMFNMLKDHEALLTPTQIIAEMEEVSQDKREAEGLLGEMDDSDDSDKEAIRKLRQVIEKLSIKMEALRVALKPTRDEHFDQQVEEEIEWRYHRDLRAVDIEQVESRNRNLKRMLNRAVMLYGFDDWTCSKLIHLRREYTEQYAKMVDDLPDKGGSMKLGRAEALYARTFGGETQ